MSNYFNFNIDDSNFSERLNDLRKKLQDKAIDFNNSEKEKTGYYYLTNLIDRSKTLKFKNQNQFFARLQFVVEEFPVKNNNKVKLGSYFKYFENFKRYIKKEFDLISEKHYRNNLQILFFMINIIIALFTGLVAVIFLPVSLMIGLLIGKMMEKKAERENRLILNSNKTE